MLCQVEDHTAPYPSYNLKESTSCQLLFQMWVGNGHFFLLVFHLNSVLVSPKNMHIKNLNKVVNFGPIMFDNRILLVPLINLDLLQGQTFWAFPELLNIFWNNLSEDSSVFPVSGDNLFSGIPL